MANITQTPTLSSAVKKSINTIQGITDPDTIQEVVSQLLTNSIFKSTLISALGITDMSDQLKVLENRIDEMNQYSRRNCLKFRGIPEKEDDDTDSLIIDIINNKLGIKVDLRDIGRTHRTGPSHPDYPRDIIVRFLSYRTRAAVYDARSNLAETVLESHNHAPAHIYINEALTKQRAIVFAKARYLKKQNLIQGTWTRDGRIVLRNNCGFYAHVTTLDELYIASIIS